MAANGRENPAFSSVRRGVQSIEIGGRLLSALVRAPHPMMLRDIANVAGLTPGQAHAYLVSFRKLELVEQDAATGRYQLGPFALHLGLARQRATDAVRLATGAAPTLAEETGLMVVVSVWGTQGATVVSVEEGSNQIVINVRPGTTYTIASTATGKVFAAFLPHSVVEAAITRELSNPDHIQQAGAAVERESLIAEIDAIRRAGHGVTVDRPIPGLTAIAAPVFDFTGRIQLCLTLVGPTQYLDSAKDDRPLSKLLATADMLSAQLGHIAEIASGSSVPLD